MGAACSGTKGTTALVQDTKISVDKEATMRASLKTDTHYRDTDTRDRDPAHLDSNPATRENEALWSAVESNDMKAAVSFLNQHETTEHHMYDPFGQTMVHKAASLGHCEIMMLLLERTGAKPDLVNAQLASPLHLACKHNRLDVAKFLIGCGVDANTQDEHGQTPLLLCCIHGNQELAQILIEASISGHLTEPLEVDTPDQRGLTALNCASIKGDIDMVKVLISRGGADVNQSSPKGCTPLMYSGRGGFHDCVRFLLEKKASALKQDNAGGTVLHHAIEKGHTAVLETMLQHGIDIYSAIEIADNAGRTPLFEACENMLEDFDSCSAVQIIQILTRQKRENGFGAKINVLNYTGQTPLFSAAREGNLGAVKCLVEAGASVDLNQGELVKPEDDFKSDEGEENIQEQLFFEAFKNCCTPLQVASVLGYDEIVLYLAENGADVNLRSKIKGYGPTHMAVFANKPELLMELLTKTAANPMLEDHQGRTLLDLVYQYIPSYMEPLQNLLEQLNEHRMNSGGQVIEQRDASDDRALQGLSNEQEIKQIFHQATADQVETTTVAQTVSLADIDESELQLEDEMNQSVEAIFGRRVALCLCSNNWQYKEQAMKFVLRTAEKFLTRPDIAGSNLPFELTEIIDACMAAVGSTCRDKVIKVFNPSLQLFNMVIHSSKVEKDYAATTKMLRCIKKECILEKFLLKSEESNTRLTNKIHEALLDLSYLEQVGENPLAQAVIDNIIKHNQAAVSVHKGLLAQLALLYKLVNAFWVDTTPQSQNALSVDNIVFASVPPLMHAKDDVRTAATKILTDLQKHTSAVTEEHLINLPDKIRDQLWDKMKAAQAEADQQKEEDANQMAQPLQAKLNVVNLELNTGEGAVPESHPAPANKHALSQEDYERHKATIKDKYQSNDWKYRELALQAMQEIFQQGQQQQLLSDQEDDLLQQCLALILKSLEDNNLQIYLVGVEAAQSFLTICLQTEAILDSLPPMLRSVILHTTDTNTRVRKRSIELVNQVWEGVISKTSDSNPAQIVATALTDSTLQEKAIVGRLGLFIKKALMIESGEELNKKPFQLIMGRDYEQITEFSCQWCLHKNTKVRQGALKLIVEICRLNHIDPRGAPFKQRVVNYILGLRPSLRDPLVKKINEVCLQESKGSDENAQAENFINEAEMELSVATKHRALSQDVRVRRPGSAVRNSTQGNLPSIGGAKAAGGGNLPNLAPQNANAGAAAGGMSSNNQPTIILPFSEPISADQKVELDALIQLFSLEIITCLVSQTWSSRQVAIQKVEEQVHNLDPAQRDAMYGEINRNNLQPEVSFPTFLKFVEEGIKDPVLKNYISVLELIQKALPVYFRYLRPHQIKTELMPVVKTVIQKTKDLKQKIREASMNFCLYLSHQSPIGPEVMVQAILTELDTALTADTSGKEKSDVQNSFGNSHMIASCLKLLQQFQSQTRIVEKPSDLYKSFVLNINRALKHQNPQVRKGGEALFKQMYIDFGEEFIKELVDQKPALQQKLVAEARAECKEEEKVHQNAQDPNKTSASFGKQQSEADADKAARDMLSQNMRDDYLQQPQIKKLLAGHEDKLQMLRMPNAKKRVQAIVEIKKVIQSKVNQIGLMSAVKDLVEPFSMLMSHLLRDDNPEVYLESLNLLKFIVGNLAPHMSSLDLHLMMGSFIQVIINGNVSTRTRVASDKVIIFFAKHNNIGSFVVAKEICKSIERLNRSAFSSGGFGSDPNSTTQSSSGQQPGEQDKKETLGRLYNIMQMLIQHFSIVLCYQPDFYKKMLEAIADTLQRANDEAMLKTCASQLIQTLYAIDQKMLEERIGSLDFTKKANLKKITIEMQNANDKGNAVLFQGNEQAMVAGERQGSPDQSFRDTQQSFTSNATREGMMSPHMNRRQTQRQQANMASQEGGGRRRDRNSEVRTSHANNQSSLIGQDASKMTGYARLATGPMESMTGTNWNANIGKENTTSLLPDINQRSGNNSRRRAAGGLIGGVVKGGAGFKSDLNNTGTLQQTGKGQYDFGGMGNQGIGSGIANPMKSLETSNNQMDSLQPNQTTNPAWSPSKKMRLQQALNDTSIKQDRPPLYVPTQRTGVQRRDSQSNIGGDQGYQPSLLTKKPPMAGGPIRAGQLGQEKQETHALLANLPTSTYGAPSQGQRGSGTMGSSERRYRDMNADSSSQLSGMGGSSTTTQSRSGMPPPVAPRQGSQNRQSKFNVPPPVATFQVKNVQEQSQAPKGTAAKPDIFSQDL